MSLVRIYLPWCPLKLKFSVPATRFATQTCRTSCGSAVAGSLSTKFSISLVKTLPFASQARHVAGSVGRMKITGPETSLGTSAVTQESSSLVAAAEDVVASSLEGASASAGSVVRLRFLDFLSPLNVSALTIFASLFVCYS